MSVLRIFIAFEWNSINFGIEFMLKRFTFRQSIAIIDWSLQESLFYSFSW